MFKKFIRLTITYSMSLGFLFIGVGCLLAIATGGRWGLKHHTAYYYLALIISYVYLKFSSERNKNVVLDVLQNNPPNNIGLLAEILTDQVKKRFNLADWRSNALVRDAIIHLITNQQNETLVPLTMAQRRSLHELLGLGDNQLSVSILKVLEHAGDDKTLQYVQPLLKKNESNIILQSFRSGLDSFRIALLYGPYFKAKVSKEQVRSSAQQCFFVLKKSIEKEKDQQTLLRSSYSSVANMSEDLLRPVAGNTDNLPTDQLLRPRHPEK